MVKIVQYMYCSTCTWYRHFGVQRREAAVASRTLLFDAIVTVGTIGNEISATLRTHIARLRGVALIARFRALLADTPVAVGTIGNEISTTLSTDVARVGRIALVLARRPRPRGGSGRRRRVVAALARGQHIVLPAIRTVGVARVSRGGHAGVALPRCRRVCG